MDHSFGVVKVLLQKIVRTSFDLNVLGAKGKARVTSINGYEELEEKYDKRGKQVKATKRSD